MANVRNYNCPYIMFKYETLTKMLGRRPLYGLAPSSNRSSSCFLNNTVLHAVTYQSRLWRKTVNKINDLLNRVFLNLNFYDKCFFLFWKFRLTSNCYNDLLTTMVYFQVYIIILKMTQIMCNK